MSEEAPAIALNDGTVIPQLGFGVYKIPAAGARAAVAAALSAGYRHIDTAAAYANEAAVGSAIRSVGQAVYLTTKYLNTDTDHGDFDAVSAAFEASLEALALDHVDLYLIHWPVRAGGGFVHSWRAFVELRRDERLRSIGVSNFSAGQLEQVIEATGVRPAVNQVELHPYFQQRELRRVHAEYGIATQAWAPLGQGRSHPVTVLDDPDLAAIGRAHGKTVAQVILRWHLQLGTIVIPKSTNPGRMRENFDVFDFELTEADLTAIASLDRGARRGPDPDTFDFPIGFRGSAHEGT